MLSGSCFVALHRDVFERAVLKTRTYCPNASYPKLLLGALAAVTWFPRRGCRRRRQEDVGFPLQQTRHRRGIPEERAMRSRGSGRELGCESGRFDHWPRVTVFLRLLAKFEHGFRGRGHHGLIQREHAR